MSTYYTSKYSGEQIDEAVGKMLEGGMTGDYADRQLSNLDTPQAALANLGAGVRPNLLDNGDFRAGHVVNQRGQTEYTASGYTIDRWKNLNSQGKITVNNGYLTLTGTGSYGYINQPMEGENAPPYPVTLSILTKDGELHSITIFSVDSDNGLFIGTFYFYLDNGFFTIRTPDDTTSIDIVAFKYEEGSTQTLAYQDEDGAWQLLPQPESDYATQLAKCQRYLMDITPSIAFDPAYFGQTGEGEAVFLVPTPATMRIAPSVICNPDKIQIALNNGTFPVPTAVSVVLHTQGGVIIRCTVDMSGIAAFSPCDFRSSDITSKILLSAEL